MVQTKRPYQTPKLVDWGKVVDLTQVAVCDPAFSGSCPVQLG